MKIPYLTHLWNPYEDYSDLVDGAVKGGRRIGFKKDLFEDSVDPDAMVPVVTTNSYYPALVYTSLWNLVNVVALGCIRDRFVFLTKCPWNLSKWGAFSRNCIVGVSAWDQVSTEVALIHLENVKAGARFISFDPLLSPVVGSECWKMAYYNAWDKIGWIIIGWGNHPGKWELVLDLLRIADEHGIAVFMMPTIKKARDQWLKTAFKPIPAAMEFPLRQEYPVLTIE